MRVKIGDTWHDSQTEPIAIKMIEKERLVVANMPKIAPGQKTRIYAVAPTGYFKDDQAYRDWCEFNTD